MSSKDDVFLEEARLGPRTQVLVDCEEVPNIPRLVRRFREYVLVDLAHAVMLTETGILTQERGAKLLGGLLEIYDSGGDGFPWLPQSGSFLVQTEYYLGKRIGDDIAGRLQTGRSRNDQSAAAERIYLRDLLLSVAVETMCLQSAILSQAERHAETLMPGYTHLQHAQPILLAHHLLAYVDMAQRDRERLQDCLRRTDVLPLGSGALAGVPYPIDRDFVARDPDGEVVLRVDSAAVDISRGDLFFGRLVVESVRITDPYVNLAPNAETGELRIAAAFTPVDPAPEDPNAKKTNIPRIVVHDVVIENGRVHHISDQLDARGIQFHAEGVVDDRIDATIHELRGELVNLDGTVVEEKIYHDAGATTAQSLTRSQLIALIRAAGREPVERDTLYRHVIRNGADWSVEHELEHADSP